MLQLKFEQTVEAAKLKLEPQIEPSFFFIFLYGGRERCLFENTLKKENLQTQTACLLPLLLLLYLVSGCCCCS